tara:strand:- start:57 stop:404 length:348 start_codon:yes stop_codon:yes gene_type:complete
MADRKEFKQEAINLLEELGYGVTCLWHISDVKETYPYLSDDECLKVLEEVLSHEGLTEEHFRVMDEVVNDLFSVEKTDEGLDIPYQMYEDEIVRMKMEGESKEDIQKKQQEKDGK